MIRATASRVGLWRECQAWARAGAAWTETTNHAGFERGKVVHAELEKYARNGPPDYALGGLMGQGAQVILERGWFARTAKVERKTDWPADVRVEQPIYYDVAKDTARFGAASDGHRDYSSAGPTEMAGTADLCWLMGDTAHVYDWKTGADAGYAKEQMQTLALMAARAFGVDRAVATTGLLKEHARLPDETVYRFESMELDAIAHELGDLAERTPKAEPRPGPWCVERYCPHRLHCPATQTHIAELVPERSLVRRFSAEIESEEHAAWLLETKRRIESGCRLVEDALKAYARERGGRIMVGYGKVWREGVESRLSASDLETLARKLGASQAQIEACLHEYTAFRTVKA